eukprot:12101275-Karenia_brevis.AAC.1
MHNSSLPEDDFQDRPCWAAISGSAISGIVQKGVDLTTMTPLEAASQDQNVEKSCKSGVDLTAMTVFEAASQDQNVCKDKKPSLQRACNNHDASSQADGTE